MLTLASHLYVLKQHNLKGRVFEFGCFKGYSTCCISLTCRELGLQLATFDSFYTRTLVRYGRLTKAYRCCLQPVYVVSCLPHFLNRFERDILT
jgi:hypothetical protein